MSDTASDPGRQRRRYDSPLRRERAAQTRGRILDAGAALVHTFPTWDWRDLTFRAVAERAGVGERTVYRYFPTERDLHDGVMRRLEEEAGVSFEGLALDDLPAITARSFGRLSTHAVSRWSDPDPQQPVLAAEAQRRRDALVDAVTQQTSDWSDTQRQLAAAMLDVLWAVPSYERLITMWQLEPEAATQAITWAIGLLVDAIQDGRRPL